MTIAAASGGDVAMASVWVFLLCTIVVAVVWGFVVSSESAYLSRRRAKLELRKAELDAQVRIAEAEARRFEAAAKVVEQ